MSLVTRSSGRALRPAAILTIIALALAVAAVNGCSSPAAQAPAKPKAQQQAQSAVVASASDVQTCLECDKKQMPAKVVGTALVQGGTQVVDVKIAGGTYVPNVITVKAGMPVQVVFTGKAKGCLAKPTFKSLGKSADLTTSGSATIDLGTLKPGVYKFTCAMGMNVGTITVQ